MRSFKTFPDNQIDDIRAGRITSFLVEVKPQPIGIRPSASGIKDLHGNAIKLPFRLGHPIYVRERWRAATVIGGGGYGDVIADVVYGADIKNPIKGHDRFSSPACMPAKFARFWLMPTGVSCRLMQNITEEQALSMGGWKYSKCPFHKAPIKSLIHLSEKNRTLWDNNEWVFIYDFHLTAKPINRYDGNTIKSIGISDS